MSLQFVLLFSVTVFVASIMPGPSMLLALTHGMRHGTRRTIASALGNVTVTLIQAAVSVAGLGAVLIASETGFQLIKWAGAAYLIYMGISILCSSDNAFLPTRPERSDKSRSLKKLYLQGALVTAGNPKAIVFFTAVFPQFLDHQASYASQSCILLGICAVIGFICFMAYAAGGERIVSLFSKSRVRKAIRRIVGGTFIGTGIGLAASKE